MTVLTVIVTGLMTTVSTSAASDPTDYNWQEEIKQVFGLSSENVEEGRLGFFLEENCPLFIEKYSTCFGNNPASPYGMYEFSDFSNPEDVYRWRLAENQAVMFLGLTPPDGRYYSFQSYPFSRHRDNLRLEHPQSGECQDGWCCGNACDYGWFCDEWGTDGSCLAERRQLVGMMGLNLNHLELLTDGGDEDSFGKFTVVITTANQEVEQHIRQLLPNRLAELGLSPNIINVESVPCAQAGEGGACDDSDPRNLVLGSEPEADDFIMAFRVAITESLSSKQAYLEDPPVSVLRVTFPDLAGTFTPYPLAEVPPSPDPNLYNELPYEDALRWLALTMRDTYAPGGRILAFRGGGRGYYDCLREELTCFAASEDAYYTKGPDIPKACAGQDHSVFVVGVNHSQVAPYSYSSLSIRDSDERHEIGFFQDIPYVIPNYPGEPLPMEEEIPPYLEGSVEYFLPRAQHQRPDALEGKLSKLYVAEVSPSCDPATNPHCLRFLVEELAGENLGFQERTYLNTVAGTGAWSENFILSRVIVSEACKACINNDPSGDADGDGVCDIDDVCPGFNDNLDRDGDGVPNGCDMLPGCNDNADLDGDSITINLPDYAMYAEDFDCTSGCTADINGDGKTNLVDLKLLAADWLCGGRTLMD
jgi:hypothetical protein